MNRERFLDIAPFSIPQTEKRALFREELPALSARHRAGCAPYNRLCSALANDTPLLPVSAFRERELLSVPREEIVRTLTSSGTSGQRPSRIFLDDEDAFLQQKALLQIVQDFIGRDRLPMLIIDSRSVFSKASAYTARAAGIAGFSVFSSRRVFALDENMQPDLAVIRRFAEEYAGQKVLLFGFTFMIRQYFTLPLLQSGIRPDFSHAVLIHGGGWKKMRELAVSPEQFKEELAEAAGIRDVHNYYGMTEQLGGIFMECACGHLHAPACSDVRILHPEDFSECEPGEQGIVSLESVLPASYPGHRLLTEDLGRLLSEDDCLCGRKGRYFAIDGRVPHAEIRGCSDTFAEENVPTQGFSCLAGTFPTDATAASAFSEEALCCLVTLSDDLLHDPVCRSWPEIVSFGFWLRKAHLEQLQLRYGAAVTQQKGIGHVLISAPSNMPALFAYNWAVALLAGCSCTIRISERHNPVSELLCKKIDAVLSLPENTDIRRRTAIVRFPRSDERMERLSADADARIFWGGDTTVQHLSSIQAKEGCRDILFPDRYSVSVLSLSAVASLSDEDLRLLCDRFYRDTYEADQNACSSPRIVFWIGEEREDPDPTSVKNTDAEPGHAPVIPTEGSSSGATRRRFWNMLASIVRERWDPEAETLLAKYSLLVQQAMDIEGLITTAYAGNLLFTAALPSGFPDSCRTESETASPWESLQARAGLFFESVRPAPESLPWDLGDRLQTVTVFGLEQTAIRDSIQREHTCPALRVVSVGEALTFDPVWDNQDLVHLLCDNI